MKVKAGLVNLCVKSLSESVNVHMMEKIADILLPGYDLHKSTGFPASIPIPQRDAAKRVVEDMNNAKIFPHLAGLLIKIQNEGFMGRKYPISYLKEIIKELAEEGFIYDQYNKIFIENSEMRRTRNWGTLRTGIEYFFAFLRLDIAGNSVLVRKYPQDLIKKTYDDLLNIVDVAIERRNGRIWSWEGDGGLIAFYFANKNLLATVSGMEIIHELYLYNKAFSKLDDPLSVRLAVHCGVCEYTANMEDLKKNEIVKETIRIEGKYTPLDSLSVSNSIHTALDSSLAKQFVSVGGDGLSKYYNYKLNWD